MESFLLKIHSSEKGNVAAVCDSELLGRTFSDNELCLDVDADFFGGRESKLSDVAEAVKSCATANIVGNKIISELLCLGLLKKGGIKEIQGVKYAMTFRV